VFRGWVDLVIREDKFLISRAPYAVDLNSLEVEECGTDSSRPWYRGTVTAVWFRRKSGDVTAHIGTLWNSQYERPADAAAFLRTYDDGRYGGDCTGRWDGASYWGNVTLETQATHLAILRPMLDRFPEVPPGFDGWWTFKAAQTRRL
jgi:hypothetical protein